MDTVCAIYKYSTQHSYSHLRHRQAFTIPFDLFFFLSTAFKWFHRNVFIICINVLCALKTIFHINRMHIFASNVYKCVLMYTLNWCSQNDQPYANVSCYFATKYSSNTIDCWFTQTSFMPWCKKYKNLFTFWHWHDNWHWMCD